MPTVPRQDRVATRPRLLTRRDALKVSAGLCTVLPVFARLGAHDALANPVPAQHGFSPLGELAYPDGFSAFNYVNPNAPKGGRIRLARIGQFDTFDTLRYPGRPPADIRLIYDRLVVPSADEVASFYGLLARSMAVSEDLETIEFSLNPEAEWHDTLPVTAADVVFTFQTLKSEGAPFYRQSFRTITAESVGDYHVRFINNRRGDRDFLEKIASIPIHPEHVWKDGDAPASPAELVGSGPYKVAASERSRSLELERVATYWGRSLGVNRGRWNFDQINVEYFFDASVAFEAFKADVYDFRVESDVNRWITGYRGPQFESGAIATAQVKPLGSGTVYGLVYNLRRSALADRRLRMALALAFDFDSLNRLFFHNAFEQVDGLFAEEAFVAQGQAMADERDIITSAGIDVDRTVLEDPDPLKNFPRPGSRDALHSASVLLDDAGFAMRDNLRIDPSTGKSVTIDLISINPNFDRVLGFLQTSWQRLGIAVRRQNPDPTAASRRLLDRDFDLATLSWTPSRLPGSSERLLWHSQLADSPNSYALSGISDIALDAAIDAMGQARAPDQLRAAARLFDRVFRHAMPMLPLYRERTVRVAYWDRFGIPAADSVALQPSPIDRWWRSG